MIRGDFFTLLALHYNTDMTPWLDPRSDERTKETWILWFSIPFCIVYMGYSSPPQRGVSRSFFGGNVTYYLVI